MAASRALEAVRPIFGLNPISMFPVIHLCKTSNNTSQLFANVYLDPLDHFVKEDLRRRSYIRYMDDVIVLAAEKGELWDVLQAVEGFLRERLRLSLQPQRLSVTPVAAGVDVLGYVVYPNGSKRVRRRNVVNFRRRLTRLEMGHAQGEIPFVHARQSIASWLGLAQHASTFRLSRSLFLQHDVRNVGKRLLLSGRCPRAGARGRRAREHRFLPTLGSGAWPSYNIGMATTTIEQALREFFAAQTDGIIAAYLFGSVARGTAGARSDVDVAILYAAAPPATLEGLPLDLERRIGQLVGRPVQVVVLNTAPVRLLHRVLRDGVLVLDSAKSARIRFEVRARNEFFDLQPIVARYRRWPLRSP
mgnify:FL=1